MEDTLRGTIFQLQVTSAKVLILVLMEDTLRVTNAQANLLLRES